MRFEDFARKLYLPFYKRKWKESSYVSNRDRIAPDLTPVLGERTLTSFYREGLQELLDARVRNGISHSTVAHLR